MAASKRDDSVLTESRYSVEPLTCEEARHELHSEPDFSIEIQCPHVIQIGIIGFATAYDHVLVDKTARVVSPWTWNRTAFLQRESADLSDGRLAFVTVRLDPNIANVL